LTGAQLVSLHEGTVPRNPDLSIIVPAYNEAASIRRTLTAMRDYLDRTGLSYEVILAADGDDATPTIAAEIAAAWPNLKITAQAGRHGKGSGIRRGFRLAAGEIMGFVDADYKTPIEELDKLLPHLSQGFDLAIGSRGILGSSVERQQRWYRRVGSRGFGLLMHAIMGLNHIRDTQCGFKFFSRRAALDIFPRTQIDGYMCDVEILWLADQLGYKVKEVGIRWMDDGDSRLNLVSGNLRNVADLFRIRLGSGASARRVAAVPLCSPGVPTNPEA
jgi:dolichyl-phosphate beta-glucosyltransferase